MSDELWILGLRVAGVCHFVTLVVACFTPIPPDWDKNLAQLPVTHRRFALAQNAFIGATLAVAGLISLCFAPLLVSGETGARIICACIALWWGGRVIVLQWLDVRRHLRSAWLRIGFVLLQLECLIFAGAYGWLAARG
ncbi:MAG: hypothetical protein ABII82_19395 [Verrucomicrobiota bacterium]